MAGKEDIIRIAAEAVETCPTGITGITPEECSTITNAAKSDITSRIYSVAPTYEVADTTLPTNLQNQLDTCIDGTCNYVAYDFDADTGTKLRDLPYIINTRTTTTENKAVIVKKKEVQILSITGNGTTVTVTTTTPHNFQVGGTVTLLVTPFSGEFIIESVPSSTTFTYASNQPCEQPGDYYSSLADVACMRREYYEPTVVLNDQMVSTLSTLGQTGTELLNKPDGITIDSSGYLYITNGGDNEIIRIKSVGANFGFVLSPGPGSNYVYPFDRPYGIAVHPVSDLLYVIDQGTNAIYRLFSYGNQAYYSLMNNLAGSRDAGFIDGEGTSAFFNIPKGLAVDSSGNVYVAERGRIRKITNTGSITYGPGIVTNIGYTGSITNGPGMVSTLAGSRDAGFADGQGTSGKFMDLNGIAVDSSGNLYVTDSGNYRIRKITPAGMVSTIAGSTYGFADGQGSSAQFKVITGIAVDSSGNLYVADTGNNRIRKITPTGMVSTIAGTGSAGFADGQVSSAQFNGPTGIAIDSSGNLYVADTGNNRIRKITLVDSGTRECLPTGQDGSYTRIRNLETTEYMCADTLIYTPKTPTVDTNSIITYTAGPISFNEPPGYNYSSSAIDGTQITGKQQTSAASQTSCADSCTSDSTCKGFNFSSIGRNCELFSTVSPTANVATSKVGFIREFAPSTTTYTLPTEYLKTASGRECQDMVKCNKDLNVILNNLVNSGGIRFFSTNDIPSCAYCPPRTMTLTFVSKNPVYTISTEFENRVQFTVLSDLYPYMSYQNSGSPQYVDPVTSQNKNFQLFKFTNTTTPLFTVKFDMAIAGIPNTGPTLLYRPYTAMKRVSDDSYITFDIARMSSGRMDTASVFKFIPVPYVNNGFYIQAKYNVKTNTGYPTAVPDIKYYKNDFTMTDDIPDVWYKSQDFIFILRFTCREPTSATEYVTQTCSPATFTDTVIATRAACQGGERLDSFSQGSSTQIGSAGTCTPCAVGRTGINCVSCATNYVWNGTNACVACVNGGTAQIATASGNARSCTCLPGYTGSTCSSCATNYVWNGTNACVACVNGATAQTATASGNARSCTCLPGYTGSTCSSCATNYVWNGIRSCDACVNGGTAQSATASGNARSCTCLPNFAGSTCSTCATGYTGSRCTPCTEPTSAAHYVTQTCSATTDTVIATKTCPTGEFPAGFSRGSSSVQGSGGTCSPCISSWSSCGQIVAGDSISCGILGIQYATLNSSMTESLKTNWCDSYLSSAATLTAGSYRRSCNMPACPTSKSTSASSSTTLQLQSPDGTKFLYFQYSQGGLVLYNGTSPTLIYPGFGLAPSWSYTYRFNSNGEFTIHDASTTRRIFTPIPGSTGPYTIQVSNAGAMIIVDSSSKIVWSSNKALTPINQTCTYTYTSWGTCSPNYASCGNGNGIQYAVGSNWSVAQTDEWMSSSECASVYSARPQSWQTCNLPACVASITSSDTTTYTSLGISSPNGAYLLSLYTSPPYFIINGSGFGNFWTSIQSGGSISYMKFLNNGTIAFYNSSHLAIAAYSIQERGANSGPYTLSITNNGNLVVKTASGQIVMRNLVKVWSSTVTVDSLYYGIDCIIPTPTTWTGCTAQSYPCTAAGGTQTITEYYTPPQGPNVPSCPATIAGYKTVTYLSQNRITFTRECNKSPNCCVFSNETCSGPSNSGTCTGDYRTVVGAKCPGTWIQTPNTCGYNNYIYYTPTGTTTPVSSFNENDTTKIAGKYSYESYRLGKWCSYK